MKKKLCKWMILWSVMLAAACAGTTVQAADGKTSIAVSKSTVNIGDTITVTAKASDAAGAKAYATMTLSYDSGILQFVSCSTTYGGGGSSVTAAADSFTVTLKAVAEGQSSVSLKASDGVVFDTNEQLDAMAGSSTAVTVNNAAGTGSSGAGNPAAGTGGSAGADSSAGAGNSLGTTGAGTGNTGDTAVKQSADNSLKSLTISPGTLSPAFSGSVTKYTASVDHSVTELAVSAVPVNEKAVVESVTGNTGLVDGANEVKIVVRAENGVTAVYTVAVTRAAEQTTVSVETPESGAEAPQVITEEPLASVTVNGVSCYISENFSAEEIPADFSEAAVAYHEKEYRGLQFNKGTVQLLYLTPAEGEQTAGSFYVYDAVADALYPYVRMSCGDKFIIALTLPAGTAVPEHYAQTSFASAGGAAVTAWQASAGMDPDFYLFYAMNQDGFGGWYQYDALEGTYQRSGGFVSGEAAPAGEEAENTDTDIEYLQEKYQNLSEQYKQEKAFARNVIAVAVFIAAVLLVIIINLLIHRSARGDMFDGDGDADEDAFDDSFDDADEDAFDDADKDAFDDVFDDADEDALDGGDYEDEIYADRSAPAAEDVFEKEEAAGRKKPADKDAFGGEEFADESFPAKTPAKGSRRRSAASEKETDGDIEIIDFNDL